MKFPIGFEKRRVAVNPFLRLGFDLPRALRQDRPSLLHVQYTAPLFCPVPVVVSVHDVSFLEHPEYFTTFRAWQLRCTVERTVRSAAAVLTPSEFSKREILKAYGLDEEKVVALPNGVSSAFHPAGRVTCQSAVQSKFGFSFPFILTVGDLQPRKNHLGLIRAFEQLLRAFPHLPHHLVIVGKETWYASHVRAAARKCAVSDRIHFTGFVDDSVLPPFIWSVRPVCVPFLLRGFRSAHSGSDGLRARRGMFQHIRHAGGGGLRRHAIQPVLGTGFGARDARSSAELRNCASAWNAWACSARRCLTGRTPPPKRWICITPSRAKQWGSQAEIAMASRLLRANRLLQRADEALES